MVVQHQKQQRSWRLVVIIAILALSLLYLQLTLTAVVARQVEQTNFNPQAITLTFTEFAKNFIDPVALAHAGDERLFVVEQSGVIYIVMPDGSRLAKPFLDLSTLSRVKCCGEQGLLGLAFEPGDPKTFYVNYTRQGSGDAAGDTVIARYRVTGSDLNVADPNSEEIILMVDQPAANHNGGDLKFSPTDGELYIPLGDGGGGGDTYHNSQNLGSLLAKTLRIHVTGVVTYTIPADNPFANGNNDKTKAEIWSSGWRNPWRFSFDRLTGDMLIGDVGQGDWEEVNYEPVNTPGRNYGWNICEGNHLYPAVNPPQACPSDRGYTMPFFDYSHNDGCVAVGGFVYRGQQYPALAGRYIFGDECVGNFWVAESNGQGGWTTTAYSHQNNYPSQPSSFGEDVSGELYVADYGSGKLYRISDGSQPVATPTPTVTRTPLATGTTVPVGTATPTPTSTLVPTATIVPTVPANLPNRVHLPIVRR